MRPLLLWLLLAAGIAHAGPSIDNLWKARARTATDAVNKMGPGKTGSPQRFQMMLESAFLLHASNPELVRKSWRQGGASFHVILRGNDSLLDVAYLYTADGALEGVRIDSLPKNWSLIAHTANEAKVAALILRHRASVGASGPPPRPLLVSTGSATLVFDCVDPFNPFVLELAVEPPGAASPAPAPRTP